MLDFATRAGVARATRGLPPLGFEKRPRRVESGPRGLRLTQGNAGVAGQKGLRHRVHFMPDPLAGRGVETPDGVAEFPLEHLFPKPGPKPPFVLARNEAERRSCFLNRTFPAPVVEDLGQ